VPVVSVWMLEESNITISGGAILDGITQGDGSHLVGNTITLNAPLWKETFINDGDANFDDNDTSQALSGAQTINGVLYASGTQVEAEYTLVLRDPATGLTYTAYGYNVSTGSPAYGTVEGLSFVGGLFGFPPTGVALQVVSATEGPGAQGQPPDAYADLAFPCFTPGTMIRTPAGPRRIEDLQVGDAVVTRDHGPQNLRWLGRVTVPGAALDVRPTLRPVEVLPGALGEGLPDRRLVLSQQHRLLISGWKAQMLFGTDEVLVAVRDLINDRTIRLCQPGEVTYLHLLFDAHEVIWADGVETESLFPASLDRMAIPPAQLAEIEALFPEVLIDPSTYGRTARPCLKSWEGRVIAI
jgi:Hint domain